MKYVESNLEITTAQIYANAFKTLNSVIGNKPLNLITSNDIEHYKEERLKRNAKSTVNISLKTLRAIFNLGIKWNLTTTNPAKEVKLLKIPQKEKLYISDEEIITLLGNINDIKFKRLILFTLNTGCRLQEIINIQYKDINLNQKILTIRNKINFKTKTGKIRKLPISENLLELLYELLEIDTESNTIKLHDPEQYIFPNQNGYRYNFTYISKKFKRYLRKAKLPEKFHFHCLRHTFITSLARKGVNIYDIKVLAGHSDIKTTENYLHSVTDDLRNAVNKLNTY